MQGAEPEAKAQELEAKRNPGRVLTCEGPALDGSCEEASWAARAAQGAKLFQQLGLKLKKPHVGHGCCNKHRFGPPS